ncbi:CsbD family protein [Olsenella massiliensis]|uniref:CsbD family protein n=1 Tax=Olsenella massiliensis TaxID=1622075 RepID=UPI00071E5955|nr:CsbD family protein [Olsenella massiliensis]
MSNEKIDAKVDGAIGSVKEGVGKVVGDTKLQSEGVVEQAGSKARELVEDAKGAVEGIAEGVDKLVHGDKK